MNFKPYFKKEKQTNKNLAYGELPSLPVSGCQVTS